MTKRYLIIFTAFTLAIVSLVGVVNLVVDPFDLFGSPKFDGFNARKVEFGKHARMIKAHAVRFNQPTGIILGSSRAEYGLDPNYSAWKQHTRSVYNLALPNGRIKEAYYYLLHAHTQRKLTHVVLETNLFMFDDHYSMGKSFSLDRLTLPDSGSVPIGWARDLYNSLFSLDALRASWNTVRMQHDKKSILYDSNGFRLEEYSWSRIRALGGHRQAFISNTRYDISADDGWPLFTLGSGPGTYSSSLDVFEQLVQFCTEHGIVLKVVISPVHARKLELIYQLDYWGVFEYWKRQLTHIVEDANRHNPRATQAELWDFSGFNEITTEKVPEHGDRDTQMRWYWEGSHYRGAVGNQVLACVLGEVPPTRCKLGRRLSSENIDHHLRLLSEAGARYRNSHPGDVEELRTMLSETAAERERLRRENGWQATVYF